MTSRTPNSDDFAFNEHERELLQAARQERMPVELSQNVRSALEQQLLAESASVTGKGTGALHALRLKVALWGTLGVVMVGSLAQVDWRGVQASRAEAGRVTSDVRENSQPSAATAPASVSATLEKPSNADTTDQLRLELALLEGARTALGRGAVPEAAALLDRYAARFERGTLWPESEALRIELEMRSGHPQVARRLATHFLAMYPEHPLRDRVRQLTRSVR